jgi:hypothetical protein
MNCGNAFNSHSEDARFESRSSSFYPSSKMHRYSEAYKYSTENPRRVFPPNISLRYLIQLYITSTDITSK